MRSAPAHRRLRLPSRSTPKRIGSATNNVGGWSVDNRNLAYGNHNFTAKAIDVAGHISSPSTTLAETVTTPTAPTFTPTASIDFLNVRENYSNHSTIIKGTAEDLDIRHALVVGHVAHDRGPGGR